MTEPDALPAIGRVNLDQIADQAQIVAANNPAPSDLNTLALLVVCLANG
jgi:hypothetical protein